MDDADAERLDREAKEAGLSKADFVRRALGWETTGLSTRTPAVRDVAQMSPRPDIDPDKQPGMAALQQIARKLKGT